MKKLLWAVVVIFVGFWAVWIGIFYYKNLRGIGPAVRAPKQDISELIQSSSSNVPAESEPFPGVNTTGFPLQLPPGFSIEIFAEDLPGARVMARDANYMIVSQTSQGKITTLQIKDDGTIGDRFSISARKLQNPHGVVMESKYPYRIFFAEEDKITASCALGGCHSPDAKIVDLPTGGNHTTRTLGFGPDGRLYVSIGSSCNVCDEEDARRAAIYVVDIENKKLIPYATGLRNSVFFTWNPVDGRMWATEMGRDLLGDDLPPDEINIVEEGKDYGWPYCYGQQVHDEKFEHRNSEHSSCATTEGSYIDLPAHSAPLGLAFIPEEGWPEEYWYDLLVAYHGSWNRTKPTGYKVVRIKLDAQGNYKGTEDFITSWLKDDGTALGRPVDILVQPGGVAYISDDKAGVIYKVTYQDYAH